MYKCELKGSYDHVISAIADFLTCGNQSLQHQWKCADRKVKDIFN